MSSASRRQQKSKQSNNKTLTNEDLIAYLIRKNSSGGTPVSPDEVSVRLVIEEGHDVPSTTQITNLAKAISLSLERDVDLIGITLDNDPPVIKAAELAKLEYKAQQNQKKAQQQQSAARKETKSMRFKAGIDHHDLERKVSQLTSYLQMGNDCEYTVFTKGRTLRSNPDAGMELVDRIQELISDFATLKKPPETNDTKSFWKVRLAPKK
jgi:translation initiation factor IF-3